MQLQHDVVGGTSGLDARWGRTWSENLLATFTDNGVNELPWLRLLERQLGALEPPFALPGRPLRRWTGCASVGGKGEILVAE